MLEKVSLKSEFYGRIRRAGAGAVAKHEDPIGISVRGRQVETVTGYNPVPVAVCRRFFSDLDSSSSGSRF